MKVGDLVKLSSRADENHLWMVLVAYKSDPSIYVQSLRTGYKMNANKMAFEVISESR